MPALQVSTIDAKGVGARILRGGEGSKVTVFVDGAVPGVTPYGSGAHLWGDVPRRFAEESRVVVIDGAIAPAYSTLDDMKAHLLAVLRALALPRCHLVAHDTAGLAALLLSCEVPELIGAVTAVSSIAATPTGDGVENMTLAFAPSPCESHQAQRWALERLSYSHLHVVDALVDACAVTAGSAAWREAAARMAQPDASRRWVGALARAKAGLFEICRGKGVPVPVQVVWGTHDPLGTMDQGLWLFRLLAQRQPQAHFHVINRAGALPFREGADAFHQAVAAFGDAVVRPD